MKVRAIARGYNGAVREIGDVFDMPEGSTATWFKAVEPANKIEAARPAASIKNKSTKTAVEDSDLA